MNITDLFFKAAAYHPERIAIVEGKRSISYATLAQEVRATAGYFAKRGIGPGDRVLVFVPMSIDLYRTVLALFYRGATAVFLDEWVSRERLALCCRLADCKGFIGIWKARLLGYFSKEIRRIPIKLSLRGRGAAQPNATPVDAGQTALITFTTGSTGTPKAADRSHGFLAEQFGALIDKIRPEPTDVDLCLLPIVLFVNLGVGCTSVLAKFNVKKPERLRPGRIVAQLQHEGVTRMTASPYFVERLAEFLETESLPLPTLDRIFTGGAPVFPQQAALFRRAFPTSIVHIVYGSTEAEPISSIRADHLTDTTDGLPVGRVYRKTEVRIVRISDGALDRVAFKNSILPDGEVGEICVAGPHVLRRYFKNEEAFEANKITDGNIIWHRTGDSGFLRNGHLFLTGRCGQIIQHRGRTYFPFLIEQRLQQIPGIGIGTLLKLEDRLVLVIESTEKRATLEPQLSDFKYDELRVLSGIPRDPRHHSKIDYARLRREVERA